MTESMPIGSYLIGEHHIHLTGIGGVSMCALAQVLASRGLRITGSDMQESATTRLLEESGIPVVIGHFAENVTGADCVIRTAAVHDDNPEIASARAQDIPVFERAQALGELMRHYRNAVCVAGSHGKTTTTSMLTHIYIEAGADPTAMIGGYLPLLGGGHRVGNGDTIILESCEYCNSFHNFLPTLAVILNVDNDHLDFFGTLENVKESFRHFAGLVPEDRGMVLVNGEDTNAMDCLAGLERKLVTFGFDSRCDIHPENPTEDLRQFDVVVGTEFYCRAELNVIGRHNAMNALAAAGAAALSGIPGEAAAAGLRSFGGTQRRLEFKGTFRGAAVYDDYAHHPNEVRATLETVRDYMNGRILCVFQPHTYSRTKNLFAEFLSVLALPDVTLLTPIYAAREQNVYGISSADLAARLPNAEYLPSLDAVTERLRELALPGDIILTMGAGDIWKVGEALLEQGE